MMKARELQLNQQQQHQKPQQIQMQQLLLQRQVQQQQQQQQQRREGSQILNGTANELVGNDPLMRQSPATKMYEDTFKRPIQRDSMDDAAMKVLSSY